MIKVFSALVLTSFLAVLLVPVTASAVRNPAFPNCSSQCVTVSVQCNCGEDPIVASNPYYCLNGNRYGADETGRTSCLAAIGGSTTGGGSITTVSGLLAKLRQISDWVFQGLLIIAGIFLIVAGYFFVTGGGEPEKVNKARQMLINALIGVAIAVAAKGLVMLVENLVGT